MISTRLISLLRGLFAYEPIRHQRWELVLLRVVLALLVWDTYCGWVGFMTEPLQALKALIFNPWDWHVPYHSQPHPNGLATWFDLTWIADETTGRVLRLSSIASLIAYMAGVRAVWSLALPLFYGLLSSTLTNSQGYIGHTAHALHLVLLMVWLGSLISEVYRLKNKALPLGFSAEEFQADLARQGLAAAYVVSGITKLINSHGDWFTDAKYLPLHVNKNNDMQYYDTLDAAARQLDWLPQVMMQHPLLCQCVFAVALPLELFAFFGLLNRRLAALIGLGLIAFHSTVTELMQLSFIFNKLLLLVWFVAPWWWIAKWLGKTHSPTVKA